MPTGGEKHDSRVPLFDLPRDETSRRTCRPYVARRNEWSRRRFRTHFKKKDRWIVRGAIVSLREEMRFGRIG